MRTRREDSGRDLGWLRALGLMAVTGILSVTNPAVLVGVPLAFLALFLPGRRVTSGLMAVLVGVLVFSGGSVSGLWYFERGWALLLGGWFLAVTLRWPQGTFFSRGLVAVAGAFSAMALLFWSRPGQWAVVDWAVTDRMEGGMATALQAVRISVGPGVVTADMEARLLEAMRLNGIVFPAILGLASLAALGTAWWLYLRLSRSRDPGIGRISDFRFNDQLVWVLILGFIGLLGFSGFVERMGVNAVVFMGLLYALRGLAVGFALMGGPTFLSSVALVVAFVVAAPFVVAGAFVFGLGDTWLNFRARRGAESSR